MPSELTCLQIQAIEHAEACERMAAKGVKHPDVAKDDYKFRLKHRNGIGTWDKYLCSWLKAVKKLERAKRFGMSQYYGEVYDKIGEGYYSAPGSTQENAATEHQAPSQIPQQEETTPN